MLKVRLSKSSELNEDVVQAHKLKSSFCLRHVLKDRKRHFSYEGALWTLALEMLWQTKVK